MSSKEKAKLLGFPGPASRFKIEHMDLLKLSFKGASAEKDVIPEIKITDIPDQYVVPHVTRKVLAMNSSKKKKRDETLIDTVVDDLLRVVKLNYFPLMIRNQSQYEIYIKNEDLVAAKPEFVIKLRDKSIVAVEDKHLKPVRPDTGFGEAQLAIEILVSGCDSMYDCYLW